MSVIFFENCTLIYVMTFTVIILTIVVIRFQSV